MNKILMYIVVGLLIALLLVGLLALEGFILMWVVNTLVPFVFPSVTLHLSYMQGVVLAIVLGVFGSFFRGSSSSK